MNFQRRGIALVMALLILVGLLLLGLPFLFSQATSRTGAATLAARQAAQMYASSAVTLGAALAAYTQERYWQEPPSAPQPNQGPLPWTDMTRSLVAGIAQFNPTSSTEPQGIVAVPGQNRIAIDPVGLGLGWGQVDSRVQVSITLEDESGKIDANTLGPLGWMEVLKTAGIYDADMASGDPAKNTSDPTAKAPPQRYRLPYLDDMVDETTKLWFWSKTTDSHGNSHWDRVKGHNYTNAGQLADAIVLHRLVFGPFRRLEDLLAVNPRATADTWFRDPGFPGTTMRGDLADKPLYRAGLTRDELERLRPLVTFHAYGPGRQGLYDLGNQCGLDGSPDGNTVYLDTTPFDAKAPLILGKDLGIASPGASTLKWSLLFGSPNNTDGMSLRGYNNFDPQPGTPLLGWVGAPLNINQARPEVVTALRGRLTEPPVTSPPSDIVRHREDLPQEWLPWTGIAAVAAFTTYQRDGTPNPTLATDQRSHAPLDVASSGIVRVQAQVQVTDGQGRNLASVNRSVVVQALPQPSGGLPVAWRNQADLETLVRRGATSQARTFPNDARLAAGPLRDARSDTAIGPGALPGLGDQSTSPSWLQVAPTATPWVPTSGPSGWQMVTASSPARTADGWVVTGGQGLLWNLDPAFTGVNQGRHVGFWISPQDAVSADQVLMEVRNTAPGEDQRNLLRLSWQAAQQCLVLRLRTPAAPDQYPTGVPPDDPTTDADEQTGPWEARTSWGPTSDTLPTNEVVVARYMPSGLEKDRWYFVQIALGGTTPGALALLVDGVVGRDLSQTTDDGVILQDGDYAMLPQAVFMGPAMGPATPTAANRSSLRPETAPPAQSFGNRVPAKISAFWKKANFPYQTLDAIFPPQGMIRINNEYIRYESISDQGFERCWRGERQDTWVGGSYEIPATESHDIGATILPGCFWVRSGTALWTYKATLHDPIPAPSMPVDGTASLAHGTVDVADYGDHNDVLRYTLAPGSPDFPGAGVIRLGAGSYWTYTGCGGGELRNLDRIANTATANYLSDLQSGPISLRLCSIAVEGGAAGTAPNLIPDLTGFMGSPSALVQVMGADGAAEWLMVDAIYRPAAGLGYLLNKNGFPGSNARGRERTVRQAFAVGGSAVLVQTQLETPGYMLHDGDVVSLRYQSAPPASAGAFSWVHRRVRHVAHDFYPTVDTNDGKFAFDETDATAPLPPAITEMLIGQGWSMSPLLRTDGSKDASGLIPAASRLPQVEDWVGAPSAAVAIGGPQVADSSNVSMLVDGLVAGPLVNQQSAQGPLSVVGAFQRDGITAVSPVDANAFNLSFTISGFGYGAIPAMGLLLVDGEVMAYRKQDGTSANNSVTPPIPAIPNRVVILARGLLGSAVRDHGDIKGKSVLFLPIGPVRQLINGPNVGQNGDADILGKSHYQCDARDKLLAEATGSDFERPYMSKPSPRYADSVDALRRASDSPWFFITKDGTGKDTDEKIHYTPGTLLVMGGTQADQTATYSALRLVGPNHGWSYVYQRNPDEGAFVCPPWLRGHYGSVVPTTAELYANNYQPLLIGWWPRFPSALPMSATPEQYRSRAYAWVGFPVRAARMSVFSFDPLPTVTAPGLAPMLEWRAMAGAVNNDDRVDGALRGGGGFGDWGQLNARHEDVCLVMSPTQSLRQPAWTSAGGQDPVVDGFELRAFWRYRETADTLAKINDHMNWTPPRIPVTPAQPLKLRMRAPVTVLAAEDR